VLAGDFRLPQSDAKRRDDRDKERGRRQDPALVARDEFARAIPPRRRMRGDGLTCEMALDVLGERAGRRVALLRFRSYQLQSLPYLIANTRKAMNDAGDHNTRPRTDPEVLKSHEKEPIGFALAWWYD